VRKDVADLSSEGYHQDPDKIVITCSADYANEPDSNEVFDCSDELDTGEVLVYSTVKPS